ncbi:MAG: Pyrroline-5-carboxylate reductase [Chlamydiae bacterium]|nr:Pyrroline-5-carboxylate reductase [Chlamydiota bacterium]
MGSAIGHTLANAGRDVSGYEKTPKQKESLPFPLVVSPLEELSEEDILLLAIKPQDLPLLPEEVRHFSGKLVVSILAGVPLKELKSTFPNTPSVGMMPNLAVRYGKGVVSFTEDLALAPLKPMIEELFSPLGYLHWYPEKLFAAVTALAGSGPGFLFTIVEALTDGAIAMGLPAKEGTLLIREMIEGVLTTLAHSPKSTSELKQEVTSPGGSTIAGIRVLEEKGLRSALIEALLATQAHLS